MFVFLITLTFTACSSRRFVVADLENQSSEIEQLSNLVLNDSNTNYTQYISVKTFLTYIKYKYSDKEWGEFTKDIALQKFSLETLIQKHFKSTIYEIAYGMSQDSKYPYKYDPSIKQKSLSIDFVSLWATNELSENEKKELTQQLEDYCVELRRLFFPDSLSFAIFQEKLTRGTKNGKINVYLIQNEETAENKGLKYSTGLTRARYAFKTADTLVFYSYVTNRHFEMWSTSSLLHELIHATLFLLRMPLENYVVSKDSVAAIPKHLEGIKADVVLEEGIAEYISHKFNSLYKLGKFNDVNSTIDWLVGQGTPLLGYKEASKCYTSKFCSKRKRLLTLYQSRSFVDFLINKYGWEKMNALLTEYNIERSYKQIYGKSLIELYNEWMEMF